MVKNMHKPDLMIEIPRLEKKKDMTKYQLSTEQISFYRDNGYLKNWQILDETQIEGLKESFESFLSGKNEGARNLTGLAGSKVGDREKRVIYFQGGWMIDPNFYNLIFHPAITVPISQLLNTKQVRFWHDQFFFKPPRVGGNVCWHQDYSYWQRTRPSNHITVWLSLDDSSLENGCLQVIPGSHKWGLLPEVTLTNSSMDELQKHLTKDQVSKFKPEPIEMKTGNCSFHHDHTIHGSFPNNSNRPRRAIVLNFMSADTKSADGNKPLMPGMPIIPEGQIIEGELFPVVFNAELLGD